MTIVNAYLGDGNFSNIKLSIDVPRSGNNTVSDTSKLNSTLDKERARDRNVIAIFDWEEGILVFSNNNTFSGRIWATKQPLYGKWEPYN